MKSKASDYSLHESLKNYLNRRSADYEPLIARITSLSPVQISQNGIEYFELNSLARDIKAKLKNSTHDLENNPLHLKLEDWRFVLKRFPNQEEVSIDIEANKCEIQENFDFKITRSVKDACINLLEKNPYKQMFEEEQKRQKKPAEDTQSKNTTPRSSLKKNQEPITSEIRGDSIPNRNKNSLRRNNSNPKLSEVKDGPLQDSQNYKQDAQPKAAPKNISGLGVSGLNGKHNLELLRKARRNYIPNSQESLTDQFSKLHERQNVASLGALINEDNDYDVEATNGPGLDKRNPRVTESANFNQLSDKNNPQFTPLSMRDPKDQSFAGSALESHPEKKLKLSHKSEVTFQESIKEKISSLSFEEFLDCLAVEKGILRWEEIVFGKEVVRYLKDHVGEMNKPKN